MAFPGAATIWTQTIERTDGDIADLLFATPYQYTVRHRFPIGADTNLRTA